MEFSFKGRQILHIFSPLEKHLFAGKRHSGCCCRRRCFAPDIALAMCLSRCSTTELLDTLRVKMGNVLKDRHAQNSFQHSSFYLKVLITQVTLISRFESSNQIENLMVICLMEYVYFHTSYLLCNNPR